MHNSKIVEQDQKSYMMRAIELARHGMASGDGGPFGAVIVRNGTVVGEGWNLVLSCSDPTAHGEMVAIRDACHRLGNHVLDGCDLYTTGEPCPMCLGAIFWARIRSVYYGFGVDRAASISDSTLRRARTAASSSASMP